MGGNTLRQTDNGRDEDTLPSVSLNFPSGEKGISQPSGSQRVLHQGEGRYHNYHNSRKYGGIPHFWFHPHRTLQGIPNSPHAPVRQSGAT